MGTIMTGRGGTLDTRCDVVFKNLVMFDRARIQRYRAKINAARLFEPLNASIDLLLQRLSYFKGSFEDVAEIGTMSNDLSLAMSQQYPDIKTYTRFGFAPAFNEKNNNFIEGDEEGELPFLKSSLDLVLGHFSWHSLNNLPLFLQNVYGLLRPNGIIAALLIGGNSLFELHHVLSSVYWQQKNGVTPIIAPMIQPSTMTSLLQKAGFYQPVVSVDRITLLYANLFALLKDIQSFGGQASLLNSDFILTPGILKKSQLFYEETFGVGDGMLPLTVDVLFISGGYAGGDLKARSF